MLNFPMTVVVHNYTENQDNNNAHIIEEVESIYLLICVIRRLNVDKIHIFLINF